jgi:hypothetical protein
VPSEGKTVPKETPLLTKASIMGITATALNKENSQNSGGRNSHQLLIFKYFSKKLRDKTMDYSSQTTPNKT